MEQDNRAQTGSEIPIDNANQNREPQAEPAPDPAAAPAGSTPDYAADPTVFERAVDTAREQAGAAADSLRRGEFIQDAAVDAASTSDDRLIALLSYASQIFIPLVMPIIVLVSESSKRRPFQRYHAVQSLALTLTFAAVFIAAGISSAVLQIIPIVGTLIGFALLCMLPIAYLMGIVALIYYGLQAYHGKRFAIPGLTSFLHDQGWL